MITLLTDPALFDAAELKVEGDSYRHLFRARRLEVGEELRIVDGRGRARWGKVARVDRTSATVALTGPAPEREPAFRLDLIVPTCRPERASWLVEKATEVGVHAVRFVNMTRAPRELGAGTLERLSRVAEAAVEQSHRCYLPEVTGPHSWKELGRLTEGAGARWFLDSEAEAGWGAGRGEGERGALLVGPEGGLDPGERRELLAAGWHPAGLGDRILRLETAALVGAAFLLLVPPGSHDS
ncbi:MAG TPA: RsmE family RNA methyltransferase [Thermoanaerobaculia bacterium]|nr:RsmE family RNA methyltransferase [Thermoanaerobaculia bacterium]